MKKDMASLATCRNDHIILRIISAQDPEVLAGYQLAFAGYFTNETRNYPVPRSKIVETAIARTDPGFMGEDAGIVEEKVEKNGWLSACRNLKIPVIRVLLPWDENYGEEGISATRGLLFQLGDFSGVKNGTVLSLYHTKWVVVKYMGPPAEGRVYLAPLECIDLLT